MGRLFLQKPIKERLMKATSILLSVLLTRRSNLKEELSICVEDVYQRTGV